MNFETKTNHVARLNNYFTDIIDAQFNDEKQQINELLMKESNMGQNYRGVQHNEKIPLKLSLSGILGRDEQQPGKFRNTLSTYKKDEEGSINSEK